MQLCWGRGTSTSEYHRATGPRAWQRSSFKHKREGSGWMREGGRRRREEKKRKDNREREGGREKSNTLEPEIARIWSK